MDHVFQSRIGAVASLFLALGLVHCARGESVGMWMSADVDWAKAPPAYNPGLESGRALLLFLERGGRFRMADCVLNKVGSEISISQGEPMSLYEGTRTGESDISLSYRLVFATVHSTPAASRDPQNAKIRRLESGTLEGALPSRQLERFLAIADLDSEDREWLQGPWSFTSR